MEVFACALLRVHLGPLVLRVRDGVSCGHRHCSLCSPLLEYEVCEFRNVVKVGDFQGVCSIQGLHVVLVRLVLRKCVRLA